MSGRLEQGIKGLTEDQLNNPHINYGPAIHLMNRALLAARAAENSNPLKISEKERLSTQLIKALAIQDEDPNEADSFTPSLAEHYNKVLGAELDDSIRLPDIYLNITDPSLLPQDLQPLTALISTRRKANYNKIIRALVVGNYNTVGEVRDLDIRAITNIRNLSEQSLTLIQVAFAPVTPQKQ